MIAPASPATRITELDALRGLAVIGIVWMNVYAFAMPMQAYYNPVVWGGEAQADRFVWAASFIFVEDKFRARPVGHFQLGSDRLFHHQVARSLFKNDLVVGWEAEAGPASFGLGRRQDLDRQVVLTSGGLDTTHQFAADRACFEDAGFMIQLLSPFLLGLFPELVGAEHQGDIVRVFVVGQPDQAGLAV